MPRTRASRSRRVRYVEKGEASTRSIVKWVAERHPDAPNSRLRWIELCVNRALALQGVAVGDSSSRRLAELDRHLVPSAESLLVAMRSLEARGEVQPPDERVRRSHETHRRSAQRRGRPTLCAACKDPVRPRVRPGRPRTR